MTQRRKYKIAPGTETARRAREVVILVNLIEPDLELQPWLLTDGASALDVSAAETAWVARRIETYFGCSLPVPVTTPLWQLVDALKQACPGWPDDWAPPDS